MPIVLAYLGTFIAVAVAVWLVFTAGCRLVGVILRAVRADTGVERLLDAYGRRLPDEERIKDPGGFRGGIWGTEPDAGNGARRSSPATS